MPTNTSKKLIIIIYIILFYLINYNKKMEYNSSQINTFIQKGKIILLEEIINKDSKILYNYFDKILRHNWSGNFNNIIIKILDNGYKLTTENIAYMIDRKIITVKVIEYAGGITNDIINLCCKWNNIDGLQYIFDNKIIPTNEMFALLLNNYKSDMRDIIENNNDIPLYNCIKLFITYGYCINYNNFILMTSKGIEYDSDINNDFLTDEFYKICDELNFYPKYYKPTLNTLHNLSKKLKNILQLPKFKKMTTPNLQPDTQCLINACENGSLSALKFLVEKCKLIPNNECLRNISINNKKQRDYIINKYIEFHQNQ